MCLELLGNLFDLKKLPVGYFQSVVDGEAMVLNLINLGSITDCHLCSEVFKTLAYPNSVQTNSGLYGHYAFANVGCLEELHLSVYLNLIGRAWERDPNMGIALIWGQLEPLFSWAGFELLYEEHSYVKFSQRRFNYGFRVGNKFGILCLHLRHLVNHRYEFAFSLTIYGDVASNPGPSATVWDCVIDRIILNYIGGAYYQISITYFDQGLLCLTTWEADLFEISSLLCINGGKSLCHYLSYVQPEAVHSSVYSYLLALGEGEISCAILSNIALEEIGTIPLSDEFVIPTKAASFLEVVFLLRKKGIPHELGNYIADLLKVSYIKKKQQNLLLERTVRGDFFFIDEHFSLLDPVLKIAYCLNEDACTCPLCRPYYPSTCHGFWYDTSNDDAYFRSRYLGYAGSSSGSLGGDTNIFIEVLDNKIWRLVVRKRWERIRQLQKLDTDDFQLFTFVLRVWIAFFLLAFEILKFVLTPLNPLYIFGNWFLSALDYFLKALYSYITFGFVGVKLNSTWLLLLNILYVITGLDSNIAGLSAWSVLIGRNFFYTFDLCSRLLSWFLCYKYSLNLFVMSIVRVVVSDYLHHLYLSWSWECLLGLYYFGALLTVLTAMFVAERPWEKPYVQFKEYNIVANLLKVRHSLPSSEKMAFIHQYLNDVPAFQTRRRVVNIGRDFAKSLGSYSWDDFKLSSISSYIAPLQERVTNNVRAVNYMLNVKRETNLRWETFRRHVNPDTDRYRDCLDRAETLYGKKIPEKEAILLDIQNSKFYKTNPGYVDVLATTPWDIKKQTYIHNKEKILDVGFKNELEHTYNGSFLNNIEDQILSTSRYSTKTEMSLDVDALIDDCYNLNHKWLDRSGLTSVRKVMKDYHFNYNFGFGAYNDRGKAIKRNQLFKHCGGKFASRSQLADYIAENIITHPGSYAQVSDMFQKDEIYYLSKFPKTRTICGSSFFHYWGSMVFAAEVNHRALWHEDSICVGMPLTGFFLQPIFKKLMAHKNVYEGDLTAFDSSLAPALCDLLSEIRKKGFKGHPQRKEIEKMIDVNYKTLRDDPLHLKQGNLLVNHAKGLLTGHASTSMDNSFILKTLYWLAFKDATGMDTETFMKEIFLKNYADDNIIAWDKDYYDSDGNLVTFETLQRSLKAYGVDLKLENSDREKISFLSKKCRPATEWEKEIVPGLEMAIYHVPQKLKMKFAHDYKSCGAPVRQLERAAGYLMLSAHNEEFYQEVRTLVESLGNRFPAIKKTHHWKWATQTYEEVLKRWYSPLDQHLWKYLHLIGETNNKPIKAPAFSIELVNGLLDSWCMFVDAFNVSIASVGLQYIGAYTYTRLIKDDLLMPLVAICLRHNSDLSNIKYTLSRIGLDFIDTRALLADHNFVETFSHSLRQKRTQRQIVALINRYLALFKIYHFLSSFIPRLPILVLFRLVVRLFNISLNKLAAFNFYATGDILEYDSFDIFNPIKGFLFAFIIKIWPFLYVLDCNLRMSIQNLADWIDSFHQDKIQENIGMIANNIKAATNPLVKEDVEQAWEFEQAYRALFSPGKKYATFAARTGYGKSTWFAKYLLKYYSQVIVVGPRRNLAISTSEYMSDFVKDVGCWTHGSQKRTGRLIYATMDSFLIHYDTISPDSCILVDEAHIPENSYKMAIPLFLEAKKFHHLAFMTATPGKFLKENTRFVDMTDRAGKACNLEIKPIVPIALREYKAMLANLVQIPSTKKRLLFVNTRNEVNYLVGLSKGLACGIYSGHTAVNDLAQNYITTKVCDVGVTIKDLDEVYVHDLDLSLDESKNPHYTYVKWDTIRQRCGRAGRTRDGVAYVYHIVDVGVEKKEPSLGEMLKQSPAIAVSSDWYNSLEPKGKATYFETFGVDRSLTHSELLKFQGLDTEEVDKPTCNVCGSDEINETKTWAWCDYCHHTWKPVAREAVFIDRPSMIVDVDTTMRMDSHLFMDLKRGSKTKEVRLHKDKYTSWKVGSEIQVFDRETSEVLSVIITNKEIVKDLYTALETGWRETLPTVRSFHEAYTIYMSYPGYKRSVRTYKAATFTLAVNLKGTKVLKPMSEVLGKSPVGGPVSSFLSCTIFPKCFDSVNNLSAEKVANPPIVNAKESGSTGTDFKVRNVKYGCTSLDPLKNVAEISSVGYGNGESSGLTLAEKYSLKMCLSESDQK